MRDRARVGSGGAAAPRPGSAPPWVRVGGDAGAVPAVGSAGRDVPGGPAWRGGCSVSSGLTAPFTAAGNQERGWNDPPQFSYGLQAQAGGSRRTPLTRRAPAPPAGAPPGQPRGAPPAPHPARPPPAAPGRALGAAPCRDPRGAAARLPQPQCWGRRSRGSGSPFCGARCLRADGLGASALQVPPRARPALPQTPQRRRPGRWGRPRRALPAMPRGPRLGRARRARSRSSAACPPTPSSPRCGQPWTPAGPRCR